MKVLHPQNMWVITPKNEGCEGSNGIQNFRSYGHVIFSSTKASKGERASKAQEINMNIDCL